MRRLVVQALIATLLVVPARTEAQDAFALRREPMTVNAYDGRTMSAELVSIAVPERREEPGRTIRVAALRLPATAEDPGRPVVFLMGGPGIPGSAMVPVPPYFTLFDRLRASADVLVVDPRGIGNSDPGLDCPAEGALPTDAFLHTDALVATMRARVAACAQEWRSRGADPTAYTTVASADDIADLLTALGIEKADLLAFSYGTRLALALLQRHPARVGRVVLQGVNGPGLVVKRPGPVERKLRRLGDLLSQDSTWQGPTDLLAAARAARTRLDRAAATVTVVDRASGDPMSLEVGREGFDAIAALNLDHAALPALLVSVAAGDDRLLARFVEAAWNGLSGGTVGLQARAVNCAADRPADRWALVAEEGATAPFGPPVDNEFLTDAFCEAVGYETPPIEFVRPLESAVPVLLITGALDATNPIENARDVARGLSDAIVLEVDGAAHEALTVPAVQDFVIDFLRGNDVRGRTLAASNPQFSSLEEALQETPRRPR